MSLNLYVATNLKGRRHCVELPAPVHRTKRSVCSVPVQPTSVEWVPEHEAQRDDACRNCVAMTMPNDAGYMIGAFIGVAAIIVVPILLALSLSLLVNAGWWTIGALLLGLGAFILWLKPWTPAVPIHYPPADSMAEPDATLQAYREAQHDDQWDDDDADA